MEVLERGGGKVLDGNLEMSVDKLKKMQLDVDRSPPANIMTTRLALTLDL